MKLYHVSKSRSVRVLWLLDELGLAFDIEQMPFDPNAMKTADYLEINPFGKVPVLVDGPLTMSESVAIIQYLLNRYGNGRFEPRHDAPNYGRFLQWLHFGEATLMGPVADLALHQRFLPEEQRIPAVADKARSVLDHFMRVLDREIVRQGGYLAGSEFTAADIVVGYAFSALETFRLLPAEMPAALREWFEKLKARPAFIRAIST